MKLEPKDVRVSSKSASPSANKSRIHVFVEDGATSAFYAMTVKERVAAYRALLAPYLAPGTKLSWSQTAGCSCGCSPGFITDAEHAFREGGKVANVFVGASAKEVA